MTAVLDEKRSNETHHSTTDADARLYKKSEGDKSRMSYLNHALMESHNGLVVDAETTLAPGTAERDAALTIAKRSMTKAGPTLGADKGYDAAEFVKGRRALKITPHVAQKKHSAIEGFSMEEGRFRNQDQHLTQALSDLFPEQ